MDRIPFNRSEIDDATTVTGNRGVVLKKYKTPITPKENYRMVYEKKVPLWLPAVNDRLQLTPRLDADNVARVFCFEANPLTPDEVKYATETGFEDKFGIKWIYVPKVGGSTVRPGEPRLEDANDWKKMIKFPNVDSWDWEGSKASNAKYLNSDKFITATILTGYFERLISWMDFDKAAMAMIDEDQQGAIHEAFDALADLYIKMIDKYIWAYGIDLLQFHDDWGSQIMPFFSLATVREMVVPYLKKVSDYCHSRGIFIDMHSCGKNEVLVPAYIEAGMDSWSGQPMNDKNLVYEKYGDKIILGIEPDVPTHIPPGTSAAVAVDPDPEKAKASALRFVQKYCGKQYAQKRVVGTNVQGLPAIFADTVYEESRKAFSS